MWIYRAFLCALLMLCSSAVAAAQGPVAKQAPAAKAPAAKAPAAKRLTGKSETLACRLGTEDRHARIAVVTIGGKTDSFAYYSKWKPRTCSIYLQRNRDSYSKWADSGNITTVDLERGTFLIEHKSGEYHFIFRNVDRERYCGMDGVINGSLIIRRGSEECRLEGDIMVEGTPLGEAHAKIDVEEPNPSGAPSLSPASAPAGIPAPQTDGASTPAPVWQSAEPPPAASTATTQPDAAPLPSAPADVAQTPAAAASPPAPGATAKAAETESTNPLRAFFRSLTQQPPPEQQQ